jgi:hypothetical protein
VICCAPTTILFLMAKLASLLISIHSVFSKIRQGCICNKQEKLRENLVSEEQISKNKSDIIRAKVVISWSEVLFQKIKKV